MTERSRWILDIEHDLRIISERLHALENHFEDDGLIARLTEALHQIAVEVEQIKARQAGDAG